MSATVNEVVTHLFRHEAGKIVSHLTRVLGTRNLELAEDAVQEALCRAVEVWPISGIPDNTAGWLLRTAKNRAIDAMRRSANFSGKEKAISELSEGFHAMNAEDRENRFDHEIRDDQLRMMFSCCHPKLPPEAQIAMILKILCGFSVPEIAHAFLATVAAIEKRLARGKNSLQEAKNLVELTPRAVAERLETVRQALYLLFSEGYLSQHPEHAIREDLCFEALRLSVLLNEHPAGRTPETSAAIALMCFQSARLPARRDDGGNLILLAEQDRSKWDRALIEQGFRALRDSQPEEGLSVYHLEALLAAKHCLAARSEDTDWKGILELYERLYQCKPTPIVALNKSIAASKIHGPQAALAQLLGTSGIEQLSRYHYYFATLAEFHFELGDKEAAAKNLLEAIALCKNPADRSCLEAKLQRR